MTAGEFNRIRWFVMAMLWCKFRNALRAFARARDGNVAVIFGIAAIPLIGFVGAAVDYGHANAVKTAMQAALDSTALMLSREASKLNQADLNSKALAYFNAMFNRSDVQPGTLTINATYSTTGGTSVKVTGNVYVPTSFVTVIGFPQIDVGASSTAKWGSNRLRVALVLDNTGSMLQDGKITALKTATANLLTQLKNAASVDGDVYVSIIPFVKDVSVDPSGYTSAWDSWIMWDDGVLTSDHSWDALHGVCSISGKSPRSQCVAAGTCTLSGYNNASSCTSAGICSNPGETNQSSCTGTKACTDPQYTSKSSCNNHSGTWGFGTWTSGVWQSGVWTHNNHSTWNGCFTDRGNNWDPVPPTTNYDQNVTAPTPSIPATLFPAEQYSACPKPVMGLNYDWTAMNTLVANMVANGNTNQPIGLQWGWQSLVGGGPFSVPAMDPNYVYTQVIILLSDGLNTQNRWSTNQGLIDQRMYDPLTGNGTCHNIKATGIQIYTIQVNTGGDPTSTLLQNCATDSSKFFLLTSADQIVATFESIGTNLTKLRVAQ